jgi:hypothetical protein
MSTTTWQLGARYPERKIGPVPATKDERLRRGHRLEASPPERIFGTFQDLIVGKPIGFASAGALGSRWRATFKQWREMCDRNRAEHTPVDAGSDGKTRRQVKAAARAAYHKRVLAWRRAKRIARRASIFNAVAAAVFGGA